MVSSEQQITYVLIAIAAISTNAEEGALQPAVNVDANGNGVGKVGGLVFRRLGDDMINVFDDEAHD